MTRLTVDASVGVKWALEEVHSEAARRLLDGGYSLIIPDLFFPETGNILWKKARQGELAADEVPPALEAILSVNLAVHASQPLISLAVEIALESGRTVYDSLYVALASSEDAPLVTADEKLFNALSQGPLAPHVVWVGNI